MNDLIEKIFADPQMDEFFVQGGGRVFGFRNRSFAELECGFSSEGVFLDQLHRFATAQRQRLDALNPSCGGSLLGGEYRWHAIIPPMSSFSSLAVRRHRFDKLEIEDFGLDDHQVSQLKNAADSGRPLIILGATGSGKTSLLMALLNRYCHEERVVIFEQFDELPLPSGLWQKLLMKPANALGQGGISCQDLFAESLRIRPERYVIGEIRDSEASVYIDTLMTGHLGSWATIHGGSAEEAKKRLAYLSGRPVSDSIEFLVL